MANYVSSRDSSFLLLLAFPEVVSTFISLLGAKIGVFWLDRGYNDYALF
jgi:hypothetical protein